MFRALRRALLASMMTAVLVGAAGSTIGIGAAHASPLVDSPRGGASTELVAAHPAGQFAPSCITLVPCVILSRAETAAVADSSMMEVVSLVESSCAFLPTPFNAACAAGGGLMAVKAQLLAKEARAHGLCLAIGIGALSPDSEIIPCGGLGSR